MPASPAQPPQTKESPRFRLGPVKVFFLVLLLALTWLLALVIYVPAGWLWTQGQDYVELPPELSVDAVTGTLWSGGVRVRWSDQPIQFHWRLEPGAVVNGFLPVEWRAASGRSSAEGSLTIMREGNLRFLMRRAGLDLAELTSFEGMEEVSVGGAVELESFFLVWDLDQGWLDARGRGQWPGGAVSWPMGGGIQHARLPALEGELSLDGQSLVLAIRDQDQGKVGVEGRLNPDGFAELGLRKHWIDLLGLDFGAGADPDEVLFSIRQRVIP